MSLRKCIICGSDDPPFHRFPANIEKRQTWIEALGVQNKDVQYYKHKRLCGLHFSIQSYAHPKSIVLNRNAVPNPIPKIIKAPVFVSVPTSTSQSTPTDVDAIPSSSHDPLAEPSTLNRSSSTTKETNINQSNDSYPLVQQLRRQLKNKQRHIYRLKQKCQEYRQNLKDLVRGDAIALKKYIFRDLSEYSFNLMMGQLKAAQRSPKGRRWTLEEKNAFVQLFETSPQSYELLRKFLSLPSPATLARLQNQS